MNVFQRILSLVGDFLATFWWVFVFIFLVFVFIDLKKFYKKQKERREIKWTLMEIIPPKDVKKTPKAMEQIFAAADEISEGWASFEIVGRAGNIHFFVRVPEGYRNLMESAVYAQYPEAEISIVSEHESYIFQFPSDMPNDIYDIFGTELVLARDDFYPIKTYPEFGVGGGEDTSIDPIAGITEIMSKLEESEAIWIQILVKKADSKKWLKKYEEFVSEKKKEEGPLNWIAPWIHSLSEFFENLIKGVVDPPTWTDFEEKKEEKTESKKEVNEGTKRKMAKIFFHSVVRFVYVDRRDSFTKLNISGVMGAFRQFNTNDMNALVENKKAKTKTDGFFKDRKLESRKKMIFSNYVIRDFPDRNSILNTEELATLYHFPTTGVKSPSLKRVSVKRGGPPADLPVE